MKKKTVSIGNRFPRIRYLPESERVPFKNWLYGQTRPWLDGIEEEEQDAFYQHDYDRWKIGLPIID